MLKYEFVDFYTREVISKTAYFKALLLRSLQLFALELRYPVIFFLM